jgi:preprotein translocase subunit SecA
MLQRLGLKEGEAITHPWVNKALEKAQQKVEARNFEIRKNLLKFDDVMNDQRKVIYEQRRELMQADDVSGTVAEMRSHVIDGLIRRHIPPNAYAEQWDVQGLHDEIVRLLGLDLPVAGWAKEEGIADAEIRERLTQRVDELIDGKTAAYGPEIMQMIEKSLLLQILDQVWKEHLLTLDHLRQGIGLRAYAQRDPLNEYKREAFALFQAMLERLRERVVQVISHIEVRTAPSEEEFRPAQQEMHESRVDPAFAAAEPDYDGDAAATALPARSRQAAAAVDPRNPDTWGRVARNAPCPCGSGKKYKHCHGNIA